MPERRFKVIWAKAAAAELERIASWVTAASPQDAAALLIRLRQRVDTLSTAPARGRVVPELAFFGIAGLREVIAGPHRVLYRVAGRTVVVLCVFDGRRELEDVLLERLTAPPDS
jgi:toxin ParE1/3/4